MLSLFIPRVQTISKESQIQLGVLDIPTFGSTARNENAFLSYNVKQRGCFRRTVQLFKSYLSDVISGLYRFYLRFGF